MQPQAFFVEELALKPGVAQQPAGLFGEKWAVASTKPLPDCLRGMTKGAK